MHQVPGQADHRGQYLACNLSAHTVVSTVMVHATSHVLNTIVNCSVHTTVRRCSMQCRRKITNHLTWCTSHPNFLHSPMAHLRPTLTQPEPGPHTKHCRLPASNLTTPQIEIQTKQFLYPFEKSVHAVGLPPFQEGTASCVFLCGVDSSLPCVTCDWRTGDDRGDGTRRHDNGSYRHRSQIHNHPMKHPW